MTFRNYKLPLDFGEIIGAEKAEAGAPKSSHLFLKRTDSQRKSIDEHIELILTTRPGDYKFNKEYGFTIWDIEFENLEIEKFNTHNNPRQEIEKMLAKVITKFEPRLKNVEVEIIFVYKKIFKGKKIKFFVDLSVRGNIANKLEERYERSFQFAMGPMIK
jgi:phage baseplate assembly protein W